MILCDCDSIFSLFFLQIDTVCTYIYYIVSMANGSHKNHQNTQALVTMVPSNNKSDISANVQQIEQLQSKLEATSDEKIKLEEALEKKKEELEDAGQELNECHTHIQEMHQQISELEKRYEELYQAKSHLDKLFQSLNSGNDANQNRFATEKLQWNEDKITFLEEIRTKDNKIDELSTIQVEYEKTIKELRDKLANANNNNQVQASKGKDNDEGINGIEQNNNVKSTDEETKQKMIQLLDTARKYRSQNEKYSEDNKKLKEKLKAYKRRDEVNKQLRDNWNKQLNQMEQAVLLANEIYNRERTRHEAEMAEKDVEILKLRKFLLSFTNRHAKSSKTLMANGTNGATTPNGSSRSNARLSKPRPTKNIVVPKIIKAGGNRKSINRRVEQKSDQ